MPPVPYPITRNSFLADYGISPYQRVTPASGDSVTVNDNTIHFIIDPSGALAALTVTMPVAPKQGFEVSLFSTANITALTLNANSGQSILNAPTSLSASVPILYIYVLENTTWYRKL